MANEKNQTEKENRLNARTTTGPELRALQWRGQRSFRHDLFKLGVAPMKKNVSYTQYSPKFEDVEHTHFFHSHDMKGRENAHCSMVGGHFHAIEIEWGEKEDGTPFVKRTKCGPPLRNAVKIYGKQRRVVTEQVKFCTGKYVDPDTQHVSVEYEFDEHTHKIEYYHSEMISPDKVKAQQMEDKKALAAMMAALPPAPKKDHTSEVESDAGTHEAGGVTMTEGGDGDEA